MRQRAQRPVLPTAIICVDSKAYTGFDKLHGDIAGSLEHFGQLGSKIPLSYLQLQRAVENVRVQKPILLWEDYMAMARNSSEDKRWALDGEALVYATRYLSAAGVLLYYEASEHGMEGSP